LHERFNLPDNAFICLTSGRFVSQKGHRHLVTAAKALAEKYDDIFFLWLGDGPLQSILAAHIKSLKLTDRFVFCGMLENHSRAVFGADVYVHPAIVEPYGIVLVEAMAAGLPIVATRVGGIPEVVVEDKTALLIDPADPEKLTIAIERMYNDNTLRTAFGQAGFDRFEQRFRMETMIDKVEKVLIEALKK
jgi:glycosyltransferase involved in cell wall biosynthesis